MIGSQLGVALNMQLFIGLHWTYDDEVGWVKLDFTYFVML